VLDFAPSPGALTSCRITLRQLSDIDIPGEDKDFKYPSNLASPLQILIDASNGASDYGNKFGEPLIQVRLQLGSEWQDRLVCF
jgi:phosphoribosylformylglycinamidine (FGAM) synthase-like enzyme